MKHEDVVEVEDGTRFKSVEGVWDRESVRKERTRGVRMVEMGVCEGIVLVGRSCLPGGLFGIGRGDVVAKAYSGLLFVVVVNRK